MLRSGAYDTLFGDGDGDGGLIGGAIDFGKKVIGGVTGVVSDVLDFGTTEQVVDAGATQPYDYSNNSAGYTSWEQAFNAQNDAYSSTVDDIVNELTFGSSQASNDRASGKSWSDSNKPFGWCWVAREVYGSNNPKWLMFREWLFTKAPIWFKNLYGKYGERFAKFISNKPRVKKLIRKWMDTKIK